jgi:hypothetical protein
MPGIGDSTQRHGFRVLPLTRKLVRMYNACRHEWGHHFKYTGAELIGLTAIGRTTVRVLQINCEDALTLRESLMAEGIF